jgi:anti-sigma factor RsiW
MKCRKAQRWISRDLDGELHGRQKAALDAHVKTCAACARVREKWGLLGIRLRETPAVPSAQTPEAAWADVRRSIRDAGGSASAGERFWVLSPGLRWAAVAAAVTVMGVAGGLLALQRTRIVAAAPSTTVEWAETGLPGAAPMVYEDAGSGLTVIWVVESSKEGGHAGT